MKTCKNCGIIFEESLEEVTQKSLYREDEDGGGSWLYYTECPLCKVREELFTEQDRYSGGYACYDKELLKQARELNIKTIN